jgi:hypothetical protein
MTDDIKALEKRFIDEVLANRNPNVDSLKALAHLASIIEQSQEIDNDEV